MKVKHGDLYSIIVHGKLKLLGLVNTLFGKLCLTNVVNCWLTLTFVRIEYPYFKNISHEFPPKENEARPKKGKMKTKKRMQSCHFPQGKFKSSYSSGVHAQSRS